MAVASSSERSYRELVRAAAQGGSLPPAVAVAIDNDVQRTFFPGRAPPGSGEVEALGRMLRALAIWDPQVAYCQGMNFLAAFALASAGQASCGAADPQGHSTGSPSPSDSPEEDAFWLAACLIEQYGARGFFSVNTPLLKLYGFCLSRLLEQRLPEFYKALGGLDTVLGFKWFGTVFTTVLPLEAAVCAWDLLIRDGLSMLLSVALGLCSLVAPAFAAGLKEGADAPEMLGLLQRQLPLDSGLLLPPGWAPAKGHEASQRAQKARKARECFFAAAEAHRCTLGELDALLRAWQQEQPHEAAELGGSFSWSYLI